jgi:hypothetical protein
VKILLPAVLHRELSASTSCSDREWKPDCFVALAKSDCLVPRHCFVPFYLGITSGLLSFLLIFLTTIGSEVFKMTITDLVLLKTNTISFTRDLDYRLSDRHPLRLLINPSAMAAPSSPSRTMVPEPGLTYADRVDLKYNLTCPANKTTSHPDLIDAEKSTVNPETKTTKDLPDAYLVKIFTDTITRLENNNKDGNNDAQIFAEACSIVGKTVTRLLEASVPNLLTAVKKCLVNDAIKSQFAQVTSKMDVKGCEALQECEECLESMHTTVSNEPAEKKVGIEAVVTALVSFCCYKLARQLLTALRADDGVALGVFMWGVLLMFFVTVCRKVRGD